MIKENKKLIIVTSVVTLLPMIVGLLLWNKLPDTMATHFDINNQADGYSSKAFAVFGIPGFIFLCQLICVGATCVDPKHRNINKKSIRFYSVPFLLYLFWSAALCSRIHWDMPQI